jgi:hypothetical protein
MRPKVESKEDMRKARDARPDEADAVALTFAKLAHSASSTGTLTTHPEGKRGERANAGRRWFARIGRAGWEAWQRSPTTTNGECVAARRGPTATAGL